MDSYYVPQIAIFSAELEYVLFYFCFSLVLAQTLIPDTAQSLNMTQRKFSSEFPVQ